MNKKAAYKLGQPVSNRNLLNHLVENGFDFLVRSIEDFELFPKHSVIHFYTAVELFVKARLMSEHWSLVVSKRQEPDWDDFIAGDFQSVTLDEAVSKLQKVARSGLSNQEIQAFQNIRKHRNKMVHFFHEAHSAEENNKLRRTIAREQLNAWYLLHRLLTGQWKDVFEPWLGRIGEIDVRLRKHKLFLQIVFNHLQPEIERLQKIGFLFKGCPSCGFASLRHESTIKEFYETDCLVCGLTEKCISIECPDCSEAVAFVNEGFATCDSCGKHLEPEHLVDALIDDDAAYMATKDGDDSLIPGNCSNCDGYYTVISIDDERFICTNCFVEFESLHCCGWCNEPNTGGMEHSYITGCNHCDGRAGWEKDD